MIFTISHELIDKMFNLINIVRCLSFERLPLRSPLLSITCRENGSSKAG